MALGNWLAKWARFLGQRLLGIAVVLFGVATITFIVTRLLGTPVALLVGNTATKAAIQSARQKLGLDQPLYVQYWHFLTQLLQGNLGSSTHTFNPVTTDFGLRLPVTFELVSAAMLLAIVIGGMLGAVSAFSKSRAPDVVGQTVAQVAMSVPSFWLGLLLVFIFFAKLNILPAPLGQLDSGVAPPKTVTGILVVDSVLAGDTVALRSALQHLVLPAITLSLVAVPAILQITRNTFLEILKSDHIRTARAYGLRSRTILYSYVLRNAIAPIATVVAMSFGFLMSGTVLVETVFAWPGLGLYAVDSLNSQDYQPIVALVLLSALFYAGSYLLADIVSSIADPRIRLGG
jgi:peptide/nickel transport system permease protein